MSAQEISNSRGVSICPTIENTPSKFQVLGFALVIILGMGSLATAGIGIGGLCQVSPLINPGWTGSIVMLVIGGVGGVVFVGAGIWGCVKSYSLKEELQDNPAVPDTSPDTSMDPLTTGIKEASKKKEECKNIPESKVDIEPELTEADISPLLNPEQKKEIAAFINMQRGLQTFSEKEITLCNTSKVFIYAVRTSSGTQTHYCKSQLPRTLFGPEGSYRDYCNHDEIISAVRQGCRSHFKTSCQEKQYQHFETTITNQYAEHTIYVIRSKGKKQTKTVYYRTKDERDLCLSTLQKEGFVDVQTALSPIYSEKEVEGLIKEWDLAAFKNAPLKNGEFLMRKFSINMRSAVWALKVKEKDIETCLYYRTQEERKKALENQYRDLIDGSALHELLFGTNNFSAIRGGLSLATLTRLDIQTSSACFIPNNHFMRLDPIQFSDEREVYVILGEGKTYYHWTSAQKREEALKNELKHLIDYTNRAHTLVIFPEERKLGQIVAVPGDFWLEEGVEVDHTPFSILFYRDQKNVFRKEVLSRDTVKKRTEGLKDVKKEFEILEKQGRYPDTLGAHLFQIAFPIEIINRAQECILSNEFWGFAESDTHSFYKKIAAVLTHDHAGKKTWKFFKTAAKCQEYQSSLVSYKPAYARHLAAENAFKETIQGKQGSFYRAIMHKEQDTVHLMQRKSSSPNEIQHRFVPLTAWATEMDHLKDFIEI